ncbi:hypothetical protein HpKG106_10510 [Helicobacter pylori]
MCLLFKVKFLKSVIALRPLRSECNLICGKVEYRKNGTCSTTNYFVLQSLLKINKIVQVYAFFPEQPTYTLFGKTYQDSFSTSKRAENVILENFIKNHNKKPIGCTQI